MEVNSTWLITSELANQRVRKALFTCVVYANCYYKPLLFFLPRLVPESVRWLTTHKRTDEAEKLLKRVAKTNKKTMPEETLGLPEDQKVTEREAGFLDLFGSRSMAKKTVISWISW